MSEKNNFSDVLLTYGWVRSSYAVIMNLRQKRLKVAVGDSSLIGMCQWSSCKNKYYRYTDFMQNKERFIDDIKYILQFVKPKVYVPSHDETVIIAAHREFLPTDVIIPIPELDQLKIANDKSSIQEYAIANNVNTAKRIFYNNSKQLLELIGKAQNVVIRLRKGNSAKGVFYATGPVETVNIVKDIIAKFKCSNDRLPVVQEYVKGEGWGVSCLYWEGKRIAHFTHRRLREKTLTGGTSTLREHQPNELLESMAFTMLDKLKWHGLAMVEFKYDPVSKKGYFIEINPRLWGSIHLAISAGVEFPYLLYLCATEGPETALKYNAACKVKYPWRSRWYLGDCIGAVDRLKRGMFKDALKCILPGGTDTYDDINWNDPGAFLGEILYYASGFLRSGSTNPVQDGMIG